MNKLKVDYPFNLKLWLINVFFSPLSFHSHKKIQQKRLNVILRMNYYYLCYPQRHIHQICL